MNQLTSRAAAKTEEQPSCIHVSVNPISMFTERLTSVDQGLPRGERAVVAGHSLSVES